MKARLTSLHVPEKNLCLICVLFLVVNIPLSVSDSEKIKETVLIFDAVYVAMSDYVCVKLPLTMLVADNNGQVNGMFLLGNGYLLILHDSTDNSADHWYFMVYGNNV